MNHRVVRSPVVRMLGICAMLGAAMVLSGCDDNSSTVGSSESVSSAKAEARAAVSAAGKSSKAVSTDDFCSLLSKETTKVGGLSTLETRRIVRKDVSNLYESRGAVAVPNAAQMDRMTKSCTFDAARVMAQSRILSFRQLFYGL